MNVTVQSSAGFWMVLASTDERFQTNILFKKMPFSVNHDQAFLVFGPHG